MSFHHKTCSKWANVIFVVPIWRYPMTWPTQFSFRGFPSLLQKFDPALSSAWFSDFRTRRDPKAFPLTLQKGHLFITYGSTDTSLLQPEFQTSQQTVSLPYFPSSVEARPIHAFRPQYAAQDCRAVDNPLGSTQHLGTPSQLHEAPTSSSWIYDTTIQQFLKMADTTKFEICGVSCSSTAWVGARFARFGVPRCIPQALGTPQRGAGHGAGCAGWERWKYWVQRAGR